PMLEAAPREMLVFRAAEPRESYSSESTPQLSVRQQKKLRKRREELREKIRARMAAHRLRLLSPDPSPRYDELFEEGVRSLDAEAGSEIESEEGEIVFSSE